MQRGSLITSDGSRLSYEVEGEGFPVLWQHGLGANFSQPAAVFPVGAGLKRITLACRGHEDSDLGDPEKISFQTFADDALRLLDHLGIAMAHVGGISLGAAIAMRLAALNPTRVSKLVLARPAWVDKPSPETQGAYLAVAEIIAKHGRQDGAALIEKRPEYRVLVDASPDNARSIMGFFKRPRPETTIQLLSRISTGYPGLSRQQIAGIAAPTLVIGNAQDVVHPLAYAEQLGRLIPGAQRETITSKTLDHAAYEREFRGKLKEFMSGV